MFYYCKCYYCSVVLINFLKFVIILGAQTCKLLSRGLSLVKQVLDSACFALWTLHFRLLLLANFGGLLGHRYILSVSSPGAVGVEDRDLELSDWAVSDDVFQREHWADESR